ncbi:hypothetical protein [Salinigranum rubrum]|uniref:hypothetical protein n=1 Tax=Salinigranum rubrum TaxID=755307 RepID=UPI001C200367|nr:hypothetical protein [Salinigranum rubrum]
MTRRECFRCGGPGEVAVGGIWVCENCDTTLLEGDADDDTQETAVSYSTPQFTQFADADFTTPNPGVWPAELLEREQWMGHVEKKPFAPWGDRDHPDADTDEDARWKWGLTENYVDGETVAMAEVDPRLDGRAFLQQPDDPFAYVDGDDVRDPETGDVHPAFVAILEHLGLTYTDISQSGAGVHAIYRGALPEGVKQASWQLDTEPWGANEEPPSIEMYPGKRVCVMTGDHVPETPTEVREWSADVLDVLLEANDEVATASRERAREDVSTDRSDYDLAEYEPSASTSTETTDDIRDIFAALDRLDARDVAERTIVAAWNDSASTSDGYRAFAPTWGPNARGTANIVDDRIWQDTGDEGGYGGPVVMALIDAGEMSHRSASPRAARGQLWWRGIERLRELGFDVPQYESGARDEDGENRDDDTHPLLDAAFLEDDDVDGQPTSTLPLEHLDALPHAERRRAAKKRGLEWPTTREAREKLFATISNAMRHEDETVVDAPTSLGKSHTIATTAWDSPQYETVTGEQPVVHLSATRDARDEAIEAADEAGVNYFALQSRHEACPVAAGDHDPQHVAEAADERIAITMRGTPASRWLQQMCEGRGIAFSAAHRFLEEHNDQGAELPCCRSTSTTYDEDAGDFDDGDSGVCPAIAQWDRLRSKRENGNLALVIATHPFAHVPSLRMRTNLVIDEEPDFTADLEKERIERAVTAFLKAADAPVTTWESFVQLSLYDGWGDDAAAEREQLQRCLEFQPDREWYFEHPDAHTLAPALARAIFHAEERGNGRRVGKTPHEPPRLDAGVADDDAWNREWVTVTLDTENAIRTVRTAPDMSQARSVIGLDAHPAQPVWAVNTVPYIDTTEVLDPEARQLWRRYERGLRVVQVGDATRPLASGEYFKPDQVRTLVEHLRETYGEDFQTGITTSAVEEQFATILDEAGVRHPATMHYGEEKSRNDFANEAVGLIEGCIDPGDDYVVDLLAELDLEAEPETIDVDGEAERAHGRGFVGPDADTAAAILASVRENHTAQAAGRYARNPDDPESHATVFVRTDAMPTDFADVQVDGVQWTFTDTQRAIVEALRAAGARPSTRELADEVGCSKEHARRTLRRLEELGAVQAFEGVGSHGATLYADSGLPNSGVVDLETANAHVLESYTWSLAISDPPLPTREPTTATAADEDRPPTIWPPSQTESEDAAGG